MAALTALALALAAVSLWLTASSRRELRSSEERMRLVIEAALDAVITIDGAGMITGWSTQAESMFGWPRAEVIGHSLAEIVIPERFREAHRAGLQRYLATGEAKVLNRRIELAALNREGREIPVEIAITPIVAGNTISFSAFVRDITERKRAEKTQHESQERLRGQLARMNLLDQTTRAITERQDLRSIFQVVIRSLEEYLPIDFGCACLYDPTQSSLSVVCVGEKGRSLAQELELSGHARIAVDQNGLARCVGGQLVYEPDIGEAKFPFPARLARGGLRAVVITPLIVEGKVFGVMVAARSEAGSFASGDCEFLRQLSEHVSLAAHQAQLYRALQDAYQDLRHTQEAVLQQERLRALGQMASGVAHDINNALSPAALYAESLLEREPNLSQQAKSFLQIIQRAIEDVAESVARIREFYRPREPQLTLARVDLNKTIRHVIDLTRARWHDIPQERGVVIAVEADLEPGLPAIMAAEHEIRDGFTNLVLNAVDAMPDGGTITLSSRALDGRVQVEVRDTGVGMSEKTRRRCLEPFFTTKGERGTGMGLAMVYGMVQRHSADLEIESEPGEGTTMRLTFPVGMAEIVSEDPPVALPVRGLQVLVVDDDPLLLKSLQDTLEQDGHSIVTADGGQAGIDAFVAAERQGKRFAAVITDLGMPHIDGRSVAAAIKSVSPAMPVIMLTGWGHRLLADNDLPEHVDRVLSKPPRLGQLRAALAALTDNKNARVPRDQSCI